VVPLALKGAARKTIQRCRVLGEPQWADVLASWTTLSARSGCDLNGAFPLPSETSEPPRTVPEGGNCSAVVGPSREC